MTKPQHPTPQATLQKAQEASSFMKLLAHPQRLCLLCHMVETPRTVGELSDLCSLPQPQVSQFLARLKDEGLVTATRDGRNIIYNIADSRVIPLLQTLANLFCTV